MDIVATRFDAITKQLIMELASHIHGTVGISVRTKALNKFNRANALDKNVYYNVVNAKSWHFPLVIKPNGDLEWQSHDMTESDVEQGSDRDERGSDRDNEEEKEVNEEEEKEVNEEVSATAALDTKRARTSR